MEQEFKDKLTEDATLQAKVLDILKGTEVGKAYTETVARNYFEQNVGSEHRKIYDFVDNCIKNPSNLKQECESFLNNPITKGMQAGFLSPILNALDPEHFILINSKPTLLINYLAGTSFTTNLKDYSEFNWTGLNRLDSKQRPTDGKRSHHREHRSHGAALRPQPKD